MLGRRTTETFLIAGLFARGSSVNRLTGTCATFILNCWTIEIRCRSLDEVMASLPSGFCGRPLGYCILVRRVFRISSNDHLSRPDHLLDQITENVYYLGNKKRTNFIGSYLLCFLTDFKFSKSSENDFVLSFICRQDRSFILIL